MKSNMKTVLTTLLMVGVVAALLGGATYAVFSDTEISEGNQMIAGTIDFSVDGQNPWTTSTWDYDLGDMKPCVVHYGEFDIQNVGVNPMNLWKKLTVTSQVGGVLSEPEYVEGDGEFDVNGVKIENTYTERCNLAAYTLYDMTVTIYDNAGVQVGEPNVLITDDQQVRIDNVNGVWIALGEIALEPGYTMTVNQSYHLSSWVGAVDPTVTNWAQGDVMEFTVELYGEQITGPGPVTGTMMLYLNNKHSTTWDENLDDRIGTLYYNTAGATFDYDFDGLNLNPDTDYSLIYYADLYPGTDGTLIASGLSDGNGVLTLDGSADTGDMPVVGDNNYPAGAKIWLVLTADYDEIAGEMAGWNPDEYLFEMNLITYDDTSAP